MDEQRILAVLRAHVAQSQTIGSDGNSERTPNTGSRVDVSQLDQLSAEVWQLGHGVGQLNPRNAGILNRAAQAFKKFVRRSLAWYTRSLHQYQNGVNRALEQHAHAIASLQQQILQLGGGLPEILQETLRTERRATQEQQAPYAELFRGQSPVLDLGCGRGEFLEILKAKAISAYGIESDHLACEEARRKFLKVVEGDLFDHLTQVADRSLGGIFCSRVVEYLPEHLQAELISRSACKLKPGGLLVIETINPDSDFPFGRNSHIDPTHLRAIYPEMLKRIVESKGFDDCRIYALAPQEVFQACAATASVPPQLGGDGNQRPVSAAPLRALSYAAVARRN